MANETILWQPQPGPQTLFSTRPEFEVMYGGSKGGGKSDVLLMEGLRQIQNPNYRAVFFRRTYPRLQEMIDRSQKYFPALGGVWKAQMHRWVFPSGARYDFRHVQNENNKYDYNGQEFHYMAFDQLEEFTESIYDYMIMQVRTSDPTIRTYVRASANPGGIGHAWVKSRFIEGKVPGQRYKKDFPMPDGSVVSIDSTFIPATVYDNKILLGANPMYLAQLMSMPTDLRKAMLDGDWNVFAGQVFSEWIDRPEAGTKYTHVIRPFRIPQGWEKFRSMDWGYSKPFSVSWWAVDYDGILYKYREWYGCEDGRSDTGLKLTAEQVALKIAAIEAEAGEKIGIGFADPAIWSNTGHTGPTIAESFLSNNVNWVPADNDRIQGKMQFHERLKFDENGIPKLYVFETCKHTRRIIPALPYDPIRVEDIDTKAEDHIYDDMRYAIMSRFMVPNQPQLQKSEVEQAIDDAFDRVMIQREMEEY